MNDTRLQTIRRNGALYQAEICQYSPQTECPYSLTVYYVDGMGNRHMEFSANYKTPASVRNKLRKYFKGETTEWEPLPN